MIGHVETDEELTEDEMLENLRPKGNVHVLTPKDDEEREQWLYERERTE